MALPVAMERIVRKLYRYLSATNLTFLILQQNFICKELVKRAFGKIKKGFAGYFRRIIFFSILHPLNQT